MNGCDTPAQTKVM